MIPNALIISDKKTRICKKLEIEFASDYVSACYIIFCINCNVGPI